MSTNQLKPIGWLCVNGNNVTYFDSFGVEHIRKEIKKFVRDKKYFQIFIGYKHAIQ